MMDVLHIEDKKHLMIGKLLLDSGCDTVLAQAEVLTSGRTQSTLNKHHFNRTGYAHQDVLLLAQVMSECNGSQSICGINVPKLYPVQVLVNHNRAGAADVSF